MTECVAEDMVEVGASYNAHLWQYVTACVHVVMQKE